MWLKELLLLKGSVKMDEYCEWSVIHHKGMRSDLAQCCVILRMSNSDVFIVDTQIGLFDLNQRSSDNLHSCLIMLDLFTWSPTLELGVWPLTLLTHKVPMLHLYSQLGFFQITPILHFPSNLTSDDLQPWYGTSGPINIQWNPCCIFDSSLVATGLQLFKGDLDSWNLPLMEHTSSVTF